MHTNATVSVDGSRISATFAREGQTQTMALLSPGGGEDHHGGHGAPAQRPELQGDGRGLTIVWPRQCFGTSEYSHASAGSGPCPTSSLQRRCGTTWKRTSAHDGNSSCTRFLNEMITHEHGPSSAVQRDCRHTAAAQRDQCEP